ncbi:MAG: hypothetical protein WC483_02180 [Candidatus Paceibacterota bacterium]
MRGGGSAGSLGLTSFCAVGIEKSVVGIASTSSRRVRVRHHAVIEKSARPTSRCKKELSSRRRRRRHHPSPAKSFRT